MVDHDLDSIPPSTITLSLVIIMLFLVFVVAYFLLTCFFGERKIGSLFEHWGSDYVASHYLFVCKYPNCSTFQKVPSHISVHRDYGQQNGILPLYRSVHIERFRFNGNYYIFSPICLIQSTYKKIDSAKCASYTMIYINPSNGKEQVIPTQRNMFHVKLSDQPV